MPYFCCARNTDTKKGLEMKIEIDMTAADFERLWINSMEWRGYGKDWEKQTERFEPNPSLNWTYAYWFDSAISLVMAKAFLLAANVEFSEHLDSWDDDSWVLLTDYASPCHLRKELVSA